MGGGGQGKGMNSVGSQSSAGRAGTALGVPGMQLCDGVYAIAVDFRVTHEVAT